MQPLEPVPAAYRTEPRIPEIARCFERLLGRPLVASSADVVAALWAAPQAIVAHGTEEDPLFFFANCAALRQFEASPEQFLAMPSRLTAEAPQREEREALLARVARESYIDDYAGIRISLRGTRFAIHQAVVWNLVDELGEYRGQAAAFEIEGDR